MKKPILAFVLLFVLCSCEKKSKISSETSNPKWKESFPGIWQATVNQPEDFNLLLVANKSPRSETLNKKSKQQFPLSKEEIKTFTKNGKTYLRFSLEKEEQILRIWFEFQNSSAARTNFALACGSLWWK
jgi:uncharacterized protein with ParB-like and HNH nuclease domain